MKTGSFNFKIESDNGMEFFIRNIARSDKESENDNFAFDIDVLCTEDNFDGNVFSEGVEGTWGNITLFVKADATDLGWYIQNGKLNRQTLPMCGERYGSRGYQKWFGNNRNTMHRSSDFGRLFGKRGSMYKVKSSDEAQKAVTLIQGLIQ